MHLRDNKDDTEAPYRLVRVPRNLEITPFINPETKSQPKLSCNYNIPKAIVAIIQIGNGGYELYKGSGGQIQRFGYAAYSLTVIPYILLSFVNLLATLCQPQYPAMFLVEYKPGDQEQPVEPRISREVADPSNMQDGQGRVVGLEVSGTSGAAAGASEMQGGRKGGPRISGAVAKAFGKQEGQGLSYEAKIRLKKVSE